VGKKEGGTTSKGKKKLGGKSEKKEDCDKEGIVLGGI